MENSGSDGQTVTAERRTDWTDDCRRAIEEDGAVHLTVHTRSAAPEFGTRDYHDAVIEGVGKLEEGGQVDRVEFDVWGKHVGTSPASRGDEWTESTVESYRAWADRRGVKLPFEHRECNSTLIDDAYSVLVPPHVLVAVRNVDGEVLGVAPSLQDSDHVSVMDLLTLLDETGPADEARAEASA